MSPDATDHASSAMLTLVGQLLGAGVVFHIHHFRATSHSKHVVLDKVYSLVTDFGDKLAEQSAGAGLFDPDQLNGITSYASDDPVVDLESLISIIKDACTAN